MKYIAHTANLHGEEDELREHLSRVSHLAHSFAAETCCGDEAARQNLAELARWAGLLHDIGKYRDAFQSYLRDTNKRRGNDPNTHHAVYGAALAYKCDCYPLAFVIAGHHAGLHDPDKLMDKVIERPSYHALERLPEVIAPFESELEAIPEAFTQPDFLGENSRTDLFVRMLFSALVDADFLDTEKHFLCGEERLSPALDAMALLALLNEAKENKSRAALARATTEDARALIELRNRIYAECARQGDQLPQGFFNLTVPTGGGKTLAAMAFALAHAARHSLRRVIVVIPYLSIIEQNADEYRRFLDPKGEGIVIENHSAAQLPQEKREADQEMRSPLEYAAENWDAPIVVTTAVQFVESLFANKPARCRKLHNIARSVVIFDEAQTLPAHLLHPLLSALRELKESYGASIVFSTATQFGFRHSSSLRVGFRENEAKDLIADAGSVFKRLQRVRYEIPPSFETKRSWPEIAGEMRMHAQSLAVVNTRRHARDLWEELKREIDNETKHVIHLSSAMCAEHRLSVIGAMENPRQDSIRWRLKEGLPCRVVSTQLVEAGVDLDFPIVFRALAPLDSIVQAAGRCNREGRLRDTNGEPAFGRVIVFNPADEGLPQGAYRTGTQTAATMLSGIALDDLATDHELFAKYFSNLYSKLNAANEGAQIEKDRRALKFRTVAKTARVIQDEGTPVIAPYGKAATIVREIQKRAEELNRPFMRREDFRRLQRFMVNVREKDFSALMQHGGLKKLFPQFPLFDAGIHLLDEGFYHSQLGVLIEGRPTEDFIQ